MFRKRKAVNRSNSDSSVNTVDVRVDKVENSNGLFLLPSKQLLSSVARLILLHVNLQSSIPQAVPRTVTDVFWEKKYSKCPNPTHRSIWRFLSHCFTVGDFDRDGSNAVCIGALIYCNRMLAQSQLGLSKENWRLILLTSLLLSQKYYDDEPIPNEDFQVLYPVSTARLQSAEKVFLQIVKYRLDVKPSLFTRYYLELTALASIRFYTMESSLGKQHLSEVYRDDSERFRAQTMTLERLYASPKLRTYLQVIQHRRQPRHVSPHNSSTADR